MFLLRSGRRRAEVFAQATTTGVATGTGRTLLALTGRPLKGLALPGFGNAGFDNQRSRRRSGTFGRTELAVKGHQEHALTAPKEAPSARRPVAETPDWPDQPGQPDWSGGRFPEAGEGRGGEGRGSRWRGSGRPASPSPCSRPGRPAPGRDVYHPRREPGAAREAEPCIPGAVEHLVVCSGRGKAGPRGESSNWTPGIVRLDAGDCPTYRGGIPHSCLALARPNIQAG